MDSPIYYFKQKLKQEKEEINFFLDLCDKYENKEKQYYNLPLPNDIYEKYRNLDPEDYHANNIKLYEKELDYYLWVEEQYNNHDFILSELHFNRPIREDDDIIKFYITPDCREMAKEIREFLERRIYLLKKEKKDETNHP